jgi:hypothetical protein
MKIQKQNERNNFIIINEEEESNSKNNSNNNKISDINTIFELNEANSDDENIHIIKNPKQINNYRDDTYLNTRKKKLVEKIRFMNKIIIFLFKWNIAMENL